VPPGAPRQPSSLGTLTISLGRGGLARLGLGSIAVILAGAGLAAVRYRGYTGEAYSPLNHFVSELGEISVSQFAWSYNLGIVVGGLGLGLYLVLVSRGMTGRFRTVFVAASIGAGVFGPLCGIFPMDYHALHRLVSDGFFLAGGLAAAVFTLWLARTRPSTFPRWLVVPGAVAVVAFASFITVYATGYHPGNPDAPIVERSSVWIVPLLEWTSLLTLLGWLACLSVSPVRRAEP